VSVLPLSLLLRFNRCRVGLEIALTFMTTSSVSDQSNDEREFAIADKQNGAEFREVGRRQSTYRATSSADSIHDLPPQLFHCLAAIIAVRLSANQQLLVIVCERMVASVGGAAADVDAVGKLAGEGRGGDSVAVQELVLFEDVSVDGEELLVEVAPLDLNPDSPQSTSAPKFPPTSVNSAK
jgi:hypothetical protein